MGSRRVKRSLAILLTYLGVAAFVVILGIFVPLVVSEIRDLINFIVAAVQDPAGTLGSLRGIAEQYGLGGLFDRVGGQLADLPSQLADLARRFLLSAGGIVVSTAGVVSALVSILTLTFFLLLGSERYVNGTVQLFAEPQQPLVRRLLQRSGGAVSGYRWFVDLRESARLRPRRT